MESAEKRAEKSRDKCAQTEVNYLTYLGITHLDFILSTLAHSDHICGMLQIVYHFVDKNNKLLYN